MYDYENQALFIRLSYNGYSNAFQQILNYRFLHVSGLKLGDISLYFTVAISNCCMLQYECQEKYIALQSK